MKKVLVLSITLLMFITLTGCGSKKNDSKDNETKPEVEDKVENGTAEVQGDYKVTNVKITEQGASNVVTGTVTNISKVTKNVRITLLMMDSKVGRLCGKVEVDVMGLQANETKDFSLTIIGDYSSVDTFEVRTNDISLEPEITEIPE